MTAARILVVDDEPDVEALVTQKFRRQVRNGEITFFFAQDGQQALELLNREGNIDVVLSDINMPRMDGLTLLEKLSELHRDLETVIVSAYGDMTNIRTAMNRGAFDFVTKPIEFQDLETTIAKTLEHLRSFRKLREEKEIAERTQAILSRYFSPSVVESLSQDPDSTNSKGEWRAATFLFTDLADFTPLVESSESEVIVSLLNAYLDSMTEIVFANGGTVMKIVGDSVHAVFGAPVEDPNQAAKAVACAMAIDDFAMQFKEEKNAQGIHLGVTRIGVHSGHAMIGNFGGENFFDYSAYGDTVNVAARLEAANKIIGTRLCVSESVADAMPNFSGRPIGTLLLKGKSHAMACLEPLTPESAESPATRAYKEAFALMEAEDPRAKQAFASIVGRFGEDPLSVYHLGRLLAGESGVEIELFTK